MRITLWLILSCVFVYPNIVKSDMDTNQLIILCTSTDKVHSLSCVSYLSGLLHGHIIGQKYIDNKDKRVCLPDKYSNEFLISDILTFYKKYKELSNLPPAIYISTIFETKYKCTKR